MKIWTKIYFNTLNKISKIAIWCLITCILFLCINSHEILAFQSRTKSECFDLLSSYQQLFTIGKKKTVTNPDGSNEIVSMSIHSRNVETFPNCRKRKLSLFIHVCFFKENICKYQYDNWCFCSNQLWQPLFPNPQKVEY